MRTHRVILAALALCATMEFMAGGVEAGTVTLTVATNGMTFQFTGTDSFVVDTTTLNADLTKAGSAYQFSLLGADSSQGIKAATGGRLGDFGRVTLGAAGAGGSVTISVSESGFMLPMAKTATMTETLKSKFIGANATDNSFATGTYNGTTSLGAGPLLGSVNNMVQTMAPTASVTVVTPYTLSEVTTFTLSKANADLGFGGTVTINPEPESVVMFVTGMMAPLVALVWRRRGREPGHGKFVPDRRRPAAESSAK
jgi:hypothetical protein